MTRKLKILVSVYACSPKRGSEPGMGWSFVNGLSKFHEVHVISEQKKWEKDIVEQLSKEKNDNLKFYFIRKKRNKLLRIIWPPSYYWYYKDWQKKALQLAEELNEKENFDLIHQLNMVGYREPGYLWKIDKPFVWGPIGGTEDVPLKLFPLFNMYGKLFFAFRNIINSYQKKFYKRPKLAATKKQSQVIAATPDVKRAAKRLWSVDAEIIAEVGKVSLYDVKPHKRLENEPLKIVWSGLHISRKALHILLRSLALLDEKINYELHILGVGAETKGWKKLAKKLKVDDNCTWYGWLEKEKALQVMKSSHVLAITSLRDLTSTITLEGVSLGLPIICLDHCGFSFVVNETCGIKIPITNVDEIFYNYKEAITQLYSNEEKRFELSKGALLRAQDFTWDSKVERLNNIYSKLLA